MSQPSIKVVKCEWLSVGKSGQVQCGDTPTKLAVRCGKWYCAFHYAIGKHFKPFEQAK